MTGAEILSIPSGVLCPRVRTRSASSKRFSGTLHSLQYSRPSAVKVTRRVVRLRSDTPSFDSSTDNRRLTVELGIPNERAARLMLSNWATLTNIRTSSRFAIGVTLGLRSKHCDDLTRRPSPPPERVRMMVSIIRRYRSPRSAMLEPPTLASNSLAHHGIHLTIASPVT